MRNAGSAAVLLPWADRADLEELYGDPLALWRDWADDLRGRSIDCGARTAEEAPAELAAELTASSGRNRPHDQTTGNSRRVRQWCSSAWSLCALTLPGGSRHIWPVESESGRATRMTTPPRRISGTLARPRTASRPTIAASADERRFRETINTTIRNAGAAIPLTIGTRSSCRPIMYPLLVPE